MSTSSPTAVIVLAAGEGTRMRSRTPKVLHPVVGRSLLGHVLDAVTTEGSPGEHGTLLVVVGHAKEAVTDHLSSLAPSARPVVQAEQHGTGHAVRIALESAPELSGSVLVVCGDTPLLTAATVSGLVDGHLARGSAATVLTARLSDPSGYGRIARDADGAVQGIVEQRDADAETAAIDEINSGIYVFDVQLLRSALKQIDRENSQGEEYLTDVIAVLVAEGRRVDAVQVQDSREVLGVNDRVQLAEAAAVLRARINDRWMRAGVTIVDPSTTTIGPEVVLEPDAVVLPWTMLEGTTTVASGASVGPGSHLVDTVVGPDASVRFTTADGAEIGAEASVGPYTYLRPGTKLAARTRAGAFVETKNAVVGEGSKVPHLSYVGDAEIGEGSNIGAATVFVNYDGVAKHRTVIGDHVRVGSDTMLVAPVSIGDGAYTAAGSVITDDVPAGAMGVGRARQRTIRDWVLRKRRGTESAAAAERAAGRPAGDSGAGSDAAAPAGENDVAGNGPGVQNDPEGTGA